MVDVQTDVAKLEGQWAFVRANWPRVSIIVILAFVVGAAVGHFL